MPDTDHSIEQSASTLDKHEVVSTLDAIIEKEAPDPITEASFASNLLEGGVLIKPLDLQIIYLAPEDEELINLDKIKITVDEYISNYHSDKYTQYKATFNQLYAKYNKASYQIKNGRESVIVSKLTDKKGDIQSLELIYELRKPHIIQYDYNTLAQMKTDISNARAQLRFDYDMLIAKLDLKEIDKKEFEKQKSKFIKLIEKYYTYTLYHVQINKISTDNKISIAQPHLTGFLKEVGDDEQVALVYDKYQIDKSLIDELNTRNSVRLDNYNDIILGLQSKLTKEKTKELNGKIKAYLEAQTSATLPNSLSKLFKEQDNYIYYIIDVL
uniref:Uncharacterized protein n=1 Tax=viral metagenome TaxID=1070528 RepID=A0A6C0HN14_9ZZZZ